MCDDCIPKIDKSLFPKFKMSKDERKALPGKEHAGRPVSELTSEELEEKRVFRRAYERIYRKWNRENGDYLHKYQVEYHINYQKNHGERLTEYVRGYMKDNPDWTIRSMERRKLRLQFVKSEKYTTQDVLDAWGTICHICKEEIDISIRRNYTDRSPGWEMSLTLDHVIPVSYGGSDTLENVKPAHSICNTKKGPKVSEADLTDEHIKAKVLFEEAYGTKRAGAPLKD